MNEEKKHIEAIRRDKFSITASTSSSSTSRASWLNPLTADLHNAVENLSAQLYAKDVHFLMELIQNAEDNEYPTGVEPSLEFIIISKDITGTGAPATLLVFNNEIGFSRTNIESLCSVGLSTKKGRRKEGFIGEKGIGFKSVFLISKHPYVFSNGYRIRFSDEPYRDCGIGYIVPEWVEEKPTIGDLESVYGKEKQLPSTVIILPLRPEKVRGVKKQLSEVHPELLLFLSKIKRVSVKENAEGCGKEETLCSISVSSRTGLASIEDSGASSWYVELFSHEKENMKCQYYMWRQTFPIDPQLKTDGRKGIDMWNVSLAFPLGERLNRRTVQAGIYAFLPTTMVTSFPFIIHSDFILASSRETILLDNEWNLGILDCVGSAFVQAFHSYMSNHSLMEITKMFQFVPVRESSFPVLNGVREDIRKLLKEKDILPCESYCVRDKTGLCKPIDAVRLLPAFRKILNKAKEEGLCLEGSSFDGRFILHNFLESENYHGVLKFLGVPDPDDICWYNCCIKNCDLAVNLCHDTYVDLICFMMDHAKSYRQSFKSEHIPIRHERHDVTDDCMCINFRDKVCYTKDSKLHAWFYSWSREFRSQTSPLLFMPAETQIVFAAHKRGHEITDWLNKIKRLEYFDLTKFIESASKANAKQAVHLACFLFFTHVNELANEYTLRNICRDKLPLLDSCGVLHVKSKKTLLPARHSKWGKLFGCANPFKGEQCIDISETYAEEREVNGHIATKDSVLNFLIKYTNALDLPLLYPPDVHLPILDANLTCEQAVLLLSWVKHLVAKHIILPKRFASSVRCSRWVKTISGFDKPESCFLANVKKRPLIFQISQCLPGFAVIDEQYYDGKIVSYGPALKQIGVTLAKDDPSYTTIMKRFVSLATTMGMNRERFLALLKLIKHLKEHEQLGDDLIAQLKQKSLLFTSQGMRPPCGSYFIQSEKKAILQISDLPVVDEGFYGPSIADHESELMFLGVVVNIEQVFQQIPTRLRFPNDALIGKEGALLLLKCVRKLGESEPIMLEKIRNFPWLKTVAGYKQPHACILYDIQWGFLTDFGEMPLIEEAYYGDAIRSFVLELKAIGVAIDLNDAEKKITDVFKSWLSSSSTLTSSKVAMLLCYVKTIREHMPQVIPGLVSSFSGIRFLKTRHGFKCPSESILFDSKWGTICTYVDLPLIDDGFHGINIYSYKNELELLGAVVDFSEGPHFVPAGLQLPKEPPGFFSAESALMLLHCTGLLMKRSDNNTLPEIFLAKVMDSKWLKTHIGYKSPKECVMIQSSWQSLLNSLNGPFLDQVFYGSNIYLYGDQLKAIGVTVEAHDVCLHVYKLLMSQHDNQVISRVLGLLEKHRWKPAGEGVDLEDMLLWLPDRHGVDGKWVPRNLCVLHDKDNLFSSNNQPLHFLEKHYNKKMVQYFSFAFDIPQYPSITAYISLWNSWETDGRELSLRQCAAVWEYIVANWNPYSDVIKEKINKVPCTCTTGNVIQLVDIGNSAIPDDLELTNLFRHSNGALFVWYPFEDLPTIPLRQLFEIYSEIGVQKLSEMVTSGVALRIRNCGHDDPILKGKLIVSGLLKILLGFLASPRVRMSLRERHEAVSTVQNLRVCGFDELVMVDHKLVFPSLKEYFAKGRRVVFFDQEAQTFFMHRGTFEKRHTSIEFITYFARAISSILPLDKAFLYSDICRLIQTGIVFGFTEDAVKFILQTENLHVFREDEEFLSTLFSPQQISTPPLGRSRRRAESSPLPTPPGFCQKKLRYSK